MTGKSSDTSEGLEPILLITSWHFATVSVRSVHVIIYKTIDRCIFLLLNILLPIGANLLINLVLSVFVHFVAAHDIIDKRSFCIECDAMDRYTYR